MKNPTLLALLQSGAKVTFDDTFYLQGIPSENYIGTGHENGYGGLWILNEDGVDKALNDLEKMREELHSEES